MYIEYLNHAFTRHENQTHGRKTKTETDWFSLSPILVGSRIQNWIKPLCGTLQVSEFILHFVCVVYLSKHSPPHTQQTAARNASQRRHTKCRAGQYWPETHRYGRQG